MSGSAPTREATVETVLLLRIVASDLTDRAGREFAVTDAMTIGRDAACDIVLDDGAVSRQHARIEVGADGPEIRDLNSTNGTFVNGEPIFAGLLEKGDVIALGRITLDAV